MNIIVNVIDAEPSERSLLDIGTSEEFKQYAIDRTLVNNNVKRIANGISGMLKVMFPGADISTGGQYIDSNSIRNLTQIEMIGDFPGRISEVESHVWELVTLFSSKTATIVPMYADTTCSIDLPCVSENASRQYPEIDELAKKFIKGIPSNSKNVTRQVLVRMGRRRFIVGGEWKKLKVDKRVTREHPTISAIITNVSTKNNSITVKDKVSGKKLEIHIDGLFPDEGLTVRELFKPQVRVFYVSDHYLKERDDSELHLLDMTRVDDGGAIQ